MVTVPTIHNCACDGISCDWLTHAQRGALCERAFYGDGPPRGWALRSDGLAICPACVAICALRENGP